MFGWRFVCLLAAGFAVATTSLLVLAADAQVETKVAPKTDVTPEPKTDAKPEAKAAVKAGTKTDVKADAKADAR